MAGLALVLAIGTNAFVAWQGYRQSLARLTAPGNTICPDSSCIAEVAREFYGGFLIQAAVGSMAIVLLFCMLVGLTILATGLRETRAAVRCSSRTKEQTSS